jgi:hypothetical protein
MTEQTQQEIKARLTDVIADVDRTELRARLARGYRGGLVAHLERNAL